MIVDGFEKETSPCLVLLYQPFTSPSYHGSFANIKPAVLILPELTPVK
jgi:hypothetical protein